MNIADKRNSKCEILGCVNVFRKSEEYQGDIFSMDHHYVWGLQGQFPSCFDEKTKAQESLMTPVNKRSRIFYYESNSIVNQCDLFC